MNVVIKIIFFIGLIITGVFVLNKNYPGILSNSQNFYAVISSICVLSFMVIGAARSNVKFLNFSSQLLGWAAIAIIILGGYSYKFEIIKFIDRLEANIIPGYSQANNDGSISFYAGENGHFTITALINEGTKINFLLDTGASSVSLTQTDAVAIGIDVNSLDYNFPLSTANGTSWGAKVNLKSVTIDNITVENVSAIIINNSDTSLLGMNFLSRLKKFQIESGKLTLTN